MTGDRPTVAVCFPDPAAHVAALATGVRVTGGDDHPLADLLTDADAALISVSERITATVLDAAPRLRAISTVSSGTDHLDLTAATDRGIAVTRVPDHTAAPTAELAITLALAVSRRVVEAHRDLLAGRWHRWELEAWAGSSLHGKTMGIVGFGAIGQRVAHLARALGMRVLVHTRTRRATEEQWEHRALDELLAESDVVSLHTPLTAETEGLIGARELAAMRPDAILINCARGPLVDEAALLAALDAGRLAGAGLDVFAREPADPDSPLLRHPAVLALPHIGSATVSARHSMLRDAVTNVLAVLECGWTAPNIVNQPAHQPAHRP